MDSETDFETISAEDFGKSLSGMGINLLVRDVLSLQEFLTDVFGMTASRVSKDFVIIQYQNSILQLHADHTYHSHPLPSLIPEAGVRGGGIEIRLFGTDPDRAAIDAGQHKHESTLLQAAMNKPHGLRECVILCENGYAWLPSRALRDGEAVDAAFE